MTRRDILNDFEVDSTTNTGLWLDKFFKGDMSDDKDDAVAKAKADFIGDIDKIRKPDGYNQAFESRKKILNGFSGTIGAVAEVQGRLIVGLGQKGVIECGITLEHTWGTPYIPGSALKGIAAWAAKQCGEEWWNPQLVTKDDPTGGPGPLYLALFGGPDENETSEIGAVVFHDAWWIPNYKDDREMLPIYSDIMTVHHKDYYANGTTPPSDYDTPVPISFVSVAKAKFEIMLTGPQQWAETAMKLLKVGLEQHGIGAKTAGGYGRLAVKTAEEIAEEQEDAQYGVLKNELPAYLSQIKKMGKGQAREGIQKIVDKYENTPYFQTVIDTIKANKQLKEYMKANPDIPWVNKIGSITKCV